MKPPILLKTILDICFVLLVFTYAATFIYFLLAVFFDIPLAIEIHERTIENFTPATIALLLGEFVIYGVSIYIIYLLRKLVRNFFKMKFFTELQGALLIRIGKLMVLTIIAEAVFNFFSSLILTGKTRLVLELEPSFNNFFVTMALGLFFIFLGKLFENARVLREEHDLTV